MNTLEDRLRDALDAAARTVPDTATGPGLAREGRTTDRPVRRTLVVLGAAAAVVAAVAVPLAIHTGKDQQLPAGPVCPQPTPVQPSLPTSGGTAPIDNESWLGRLPAGPPPRVPYTVTDSTGAGYLQDGTTRVQLAAGTGVGVIGRLDCGWLVSRWTISGKDKFTGKDIGVLLPDGTFTRRSGTAQAAALSPDRKQLAVVPEGSRRLSVIDLASGREVAGLQVGAGSGTGFWNLDGIWYSDDHYHEYSYVWKPGTEPRKLTHQGDEYLPLPNSDLVVLPEAGANRKCTQVLRLTTTGTAKVLEKCGSGDEHGLLSPDGRTLVTDSGNAYTVGENSQTRRVWPGTAGSGLSPRIWEDPRHILVEANYGPNDATGRGIVVRCDVTTGSCERIHDDQRQRELSFGRQS